ncbi:MAG: SOS response-associated peptidase family protein [Ginsengibacter sp.]
MCYINSVNISARSIQYKKQQKTFDQLPESLLIQFASRGFDYEPWPVIKPTADGKDWELVAMEWGFIPSYLRNRDAVQKFRNGYKDDTGKFHFGYTTLNVIGEEMLDKSMFREAGLQNRCLVLSSGFYEHRHVFELGKRGHLLKTPVKYPYHITLPGHDYFFMSGIYNTWTDQDTGEVVDSFSIVTSRANSLMQQVHNSKKRMPVILSDTEAEEWTDPGLSTGRIQQISISEYPSEKMKAYTVAKDFLNAINPSKAVTYENLSDLT